MKTASPDAAHPTATLLLTATLSGYLQDFVCYGAGNPPKGTHLRLGTPVVVSDGGDQILGVGHLAERKGSPLPCEFSFTIRDLPVVPIYQVGIAGYPALVFSLRELQAAGWAPVFLLDAQGDLKYRGTQ